MPDTSATQRSVLGDRARWGISEELAAITAEVVHASYRVLLAVHSKKGAKLPEELHIPRPGDEPEPKERVVSMSSPEARAFFGGGQVMFIPPGGVDGD